MPLTLNAGTGEIRIQTHLHPRNRWILVPLDVSDDVQLLMVLDTGSALTAIGESTLEKLTSLRLLDPFGLRRFVLRASAIQGQSITDLVVRLSRRVTEAGADGILGLDFLQRFTEISFHVPTLRLTLHY